MRGGIGRLESGLCYETQRIRYGGDEIVVVPVQQQGEENAFSEDGLAGIYTARGSDYHTILPRSVPCQP